MSHSGRLFLAGLIIAFGAGALYTGPVAADDDDNTYDVDFYNFTGSDGTVYLDGNAVCTLSQKQYCSQTLAKNSGSHTAVFRGSDGNAVSQSFDASTCGDVGSVSLDLRADHVEVSCNGFGF